MKQTVPSVSLSIWRDLYTSAQKFRALQPWKTMGDTDVVGIRDPSSGETGFGVVMGSAGILTGFCLYRGAEGFRIYRQVMEGGIDFERDDSFAIQNCIKLEFGLRRELKKEDHAIIRALSFSFRETDAWPEFRSQLPGYAPWFLTEAEARLLTLGLDAACLHCEMLLDGRSDESMRDGECLIYMPDESNKGEYRSRWGPWPAPAAPPVTLAVLDPARIAELRGISAKRDTPWEADIFYLPGQILDREKPYYMRMTAVCQQSSGFVFQGVLSVPESPSIELLADAICSSIKAHRLIPETIFVRRAEEATALTPLGKALGR